MARQVQDTEMATPDKQAVLSVLKYLKSQISKETQDSLKKELGIQSSAELEEVVSALPAMSSTQGSNTEPEKYEESYSSQEDEQLSPRLSPTSPHSTRADFQSTELADKPTSSLNSSSSLQEQKRPLSWPGTNLSQPLTVPAAPLPFTTGAAMPSFQFSTSAVPSLASSLASAASRRFIFTTHPTTKEIERESNKAYLKASSSSSSSSSSPSPPPLPPPPVLVPDNAPLWGKTLPTSLPTTAPSITTNPITASLSSGTSLPIGASFIYQIAAAPPTVTARPSILTPMLTILPTGLIGSQVPIGSGIGAGSSPQQVLLNPSQGVSPVISMPILQQQQQQGKAAIQQNLPSESKGLSPQTVISSHCLPDSTVQTSQCYSEPSTGQAVVMSPSSESEKYVSCSSSPKTLASIPPSDMTPLYTELKEFAEKFKTKRIRLGFTQGAVGQSLADKGYSNFAQSTISRFEQMQLSPTNANAIKQVLEKWLQEAESPSSAHSSSSESLPPSFTSRKRKKRAVFTPQTRSTLEEFFQQNQRPNRQLIEAIANQLELLPEEVRVWFCNKRQKVKQTPSPVAGIRVSFPSFHERKTSQSMTSGESTSPRSFCEQPFKNSSPSPKTSFTVEELSKSSTNGSCSTVSSPLHLSSPPFVTSPPSSSTSMMLALSPPRLNPEPQFSVAQTQS